MFEPALFLVETAHGCLVKIDDLNCSFGYVQPSRKVHCSNHSSVRSHGFMQTVHSRRPYFEGQKHTPRWINFPYLSIRIQKWTVLHVALVRILGFFPIMKGFEIATNLHSSHLFRNADCAQLPATCSKKSPYRLLIFFLWPSFSVAAKTPQKKGRHLTLARPRHTGHT